MVTFNRDFLTRSGIRLEGTSVVTTSTVGAYVNTGSFQAASGAAIQQNLIVGTTASVYGPTNLYNTLAVTGNLTANGPVNTFNGIVYVTGTNILTVGTGATNLGGTLTVGGNLQANGSINTFNGIVYVTGTNILTVGSGQTTLGGGLTVAGITTVTSGIAATTGGAGSLQITGNGGVYIGNNLIINGTAASTGTTSSNALYVAGGLGVGGTALFGAPVTFRDVVTFNGTATLILSSNTYYTDSLIELHVPPSGVYGQWAVNDGKDIGFRFHYYNQTASNGAINTDTNAALVLSNTNQFLEWYGSGAESSSSVFTSSTYGTFKTGQIVLAGTGGTVSPSTGALQVAGGVGVTGGVYVGGVVTATNVYIGIWPVSTSTVATALANTSTTVVGYATTASNWIGGTVPNASTFTNAVTINSTLSTVSTTNNALSVVGGVGIGGNLTVGGTVTFSGTVTYSSTNTGLTAAVIPLGTPSDGSLTNSNPAITTWTTGTLTVDAIDALNTILGKLVPSAPPNFPGTWTLAILGTSTNAIKLMTNFTQQLNTSSAVSVSSGSAVVVYNTGSAFTTTNIRNIAANAGDVITVFVNGVSSGTRTLVSGTTNAGTYQNLILSNNVDYGTITAQSTGFWTVISTSATGVAYPGWNGVSITDTTGGIQTALWYNDTSTTVAGTPVITQTSFSATTIVITTSSGVPHYSNGTVYTYTATVTRLSGDMYPNSANLTNSTVAGSAFLAPAAVTYAAAGVTTPLARFLYVASGSATFATTVATVNLNTATSAAWNGITVSNSYAVGTGVITPPGPILTINPASTGTAGVSENSIYVSALLGTLFTTNGNRIALTTATAGTSHTPNTGSGTWVASWNSSATIQTYDATVVAGIAKYDVTNYTTYYPPGPNLTTQGATQYFTMRFQRGSLSGFKLTLSGRVSYCYAAMPGTIMDVTAAPLNGWAPAHIAYGGTGIPGTGVGGNGTVGCATGGVLSTGTSLVNASTNLTFGSANSTNSTGNYLYIRFVLLTGDTLTSIQIS